MVELGPAGLFRVSPEGEVGAAGAKQSLLKTEIESRYGNSVGRLKAGLRRQD